MAAAQRQMGDSRSLTGRAHSTVAPRNSHTLASRREGKMEGREESMELAVRLIEGGEEVGTVMAGGAEEGREEEEEEGWKEQMTTETGANPTDQ